MFGKRQQQGVVSSAFGINIRLADAWSGWDF